MTINEFKAWLEGFEAAKGQEGWDQKDFKLVIDKVKTLHEPLNMPPVLGGPYTFNNLGANALAAAPNNDEKLAAAFGHSIGAAN